MVTRGAGNGGAGRGGNCFFLLCDIFLARVTKGPIMFFEIKFHVPLSLRVFTRCTSHVVQIVMSWARNKQSGRTTSS